ncbi:MAG: hypothetical protein US57_C0026G0006 [Candidatus Moranbacteria bacterium GW2011_GWC2_37_73]|nr:MAG: hypothetical protein UR95_C0004G0029 [Parcubacteria group bacterium GW2011_GWC1_36_108]KKQ38970.1 MAG: hypothetical protein US57_C0026G0006 [Candidatus Moranbacteria bacterium GW2011_GWC2_37_73]HAR99509.1 hypothetical protein [Candidatus Moranbacteria bacterium]HBU11122.1 hypothetical protein [Candidatus Moranbacteria bacterium]
MKKNVRNALAISGLALAIGASGLTLTASASMMKNNRGLKLERQENPSKITRVKKAENIRSVTHRRTIPGIVQSISADSLIMTQGNKNYTVAISGATRLLNRKWNTIPSSDIKEGDKIRIFGTISGTNIVAQTIRDISLQ